MLCDNRMELVANVYDNFEQINLTNSEIHHEPYIKNVYNVEKNICIMFTQDYMKLSKKLYTTTMYALNLQLKKYAC